MKKIEWSKYKEKTVFKRMLYVTFGISTVFLLAAGVAVGYQMAETKRREIIQADQQAIQNKQLILENYVETANKTVQILYKNPYVKSALVREGDGWDDSLSVAGQDILTSVSVNTQFHSIYLLGTRGVMLKTTGSSYPMPDEMDARIMEVFNNAYGRKFNVWSYTDIYGKNHDILSIVLGDVDAREARFVRGIAVNMEMGSLMKLVFPEIGEQESYLLVDTNGIIIGAKSNTYKFNQDLTGQSIYEAVKENGEKYGNISLRLEGEKTLASFGYSYDNGYYLIHVQPYSSFEGSVKAVVFGMASMTVLMVLLSLFLSVLGTVRVYRPINEFLTFIKNPSGGLPKALAEDNEFTSISRDIVTLKTKLQYYDEKSSEGKILEFFRSSRQTPALPELFAGEKRAYCVSVLRIADLDKMAADGTDDEMIYHSESFYSIMMQAYQLAGEAYTYIMDYEYLVSVIFLQGDTAGNEAVGETVYEKLLDASAGILKIGQSVLMLRADMGISGIYRDISSLKEAYQMAKAATRYRFLLGGCAVITEQMMKERALRGESMAYDITSVMECVKRRDRQQFEKELEQLTAYAREHSLQTGYELLLSLAMEMMRYHREVTHNKEKGKTYESVREELDSFTYVNQVAVWYYELFDDISETAGFIQNIGGKEIVGAAERYIRTYYMDINLNAQFLANKYDITPSYFSRIFKEHTGSAFPDYLAGIRLEEARRMLMEDTNKSVQEICEQAGYTNPSYFITLFKKRYGLTPSKYRMGDRLM